MTDNVEALEVPVFTTEQRLAIRESQVKMLTMQTQARQLQDQADRLAKSIIDQINQTASQLKVDPTKYSLDIEHLVFVAIK